MRAFVLVAALSVASPSALFAQATPPAAQQPPATQQPAKPQGAQPADQAPLPDARTIIDRHIELTGGRAATLAHTSAKMTGTFSVPAQGMSGTVEAYRAKPNLSLMRIEVPGLGTIVEGFDGTHGWSMNPMTGPMLMQGAQLEEKKFDSDFYADLHDPSRYTSMKTVEKTTFDGRPCYKISLVKKTGGEEFEFYDVATGLKAGDMMTRESPMGKITATQTYGEYKKFGDLLGPVSMKQSVMGMEQVFTINTVEYDKVDPSVFQLPAEIKALIK